MENTDKKTMTERAREDSLEGRRLYFDENSTEEEKSEGLRRIISAANAHEPMAMYTYGILLVSGKEDVMTGDRVDRGMAYVHRAAGSGVAKARSFIDRYCEARYKAAFARKLTDLPPMPLLGFDGKRIKIDRTGRLTPIDVRLDYIKGENILNIGVNLEFIEPEEGALDYDAFYRAVVRGIKDWEGTYYVFGGQKLSVRINISSEYRLFDKIFIVPMTQDINDTAMKMAGILGGERQKKLDDMIKNRRSMAGVGLRKWSVRSRKMIYIQSINGRFDNLNEIRHTAKHEFGHVLGLGDLYPSRTDGYMGVMKGTYKELDPYYLGGRMYNLVMCDHHGMISNNDIEMVVLAFSENAMQGYQPDGIKTKISKALGKGN